MTDPLQKDWHKEQQKDWLADRLRPGNTKKPSAAQAPCVRSCPALLLQCLLVLLIFTALAPGVRAQVAIDDIDGRAINLTGQVDYVHVGEDITSFPDLLANEKQLDWQHNERSYLNIGVKKGTYWIRTRLINDSPVAKQVILEFDFPRVRSLDLYTQSAKIGEMAQSKAYRAEFIALGTISPFNDRSIYYRNLAHEVSVAEFSELQVYWQVNQTGDLGFRVFAWDPDHFHSYIQSELLTYGFIYGLIMMLCLYNLAVFVVVREFSHLTFVLFAMLAGLQIAALEGHLFQFILPASDWPRAEFIGYIFAAMQLAFALFSSSFLNLRHHSPGLYAVILAVSLISALFFISMNYIEDPPQLAAPAFMLAFSLYGLAVFAAIKTRAKGLRSASFFAAAIFFLGLNIMLGFLTMLNLLPMHNGFLSYLTIGTVIMVVIFAFALANKVRLLQREKIHSSLKLVEISEEKLKSTTEFYKQKLQQVLLERNADEARIESRAKSEFLATMSHEIRTPMSSVLGMTELLLDTDLSVEQTAYVNAIYNASQSLLSVINDVLDYSKIEAGTLEFESLPFNLQEMLDDCLSIFALRAAEKHIDFAGLIEDGVINPLKGDPGKLRQILLNLLNLSFTFKNLGALFLRVRATGVNSVNSQELRFDLIMDGVVLDEGEQESLLHPFAQSEQQSAKSLTNTGLGLTVCKQLAEFMYGDLGIDTPRLADPEAPAGTSLWFTARFNRLSSEDSYPLLRPSPLLKGQKLLVINGHEASRLAICHLAESWGMHADACADADSALELCKQSIVQHQHYNLLIIPLHLFPHEGNNALTAFIHNLRNLGGGFDPLLFLSDSSLHPDFSELESLRIAGVVHKPVTSQQLHKVLSTSLGEHAGSGAEKEQDETDFSVLRVLIADDNQVNLMVAEGLLKKLGLQNLQLCQDGQQALELASNLQSPFDLILMDCEMPVMDGYTAAQKIREHEQHHQSSHRSIIVALSALEPSEYKAQAYEAGMNDFLTKPVSAEALLSLLQKHFADRIGAH